MVTVDQVFEITDDNKHIDVVQFVKDGKAIVEWGYLTSDYNGNKLVFSAMKDAVKFNNIPALTWDRKLISGNSNLYDGVRLAATAEELQKIAYLSGCMLMTPKIADLLYHAAGSTNGTQLDSVVNVHGNIVAISNIHDVHLALEAAIAVAGGFKGGFVEAVGKYWVICYELLIGQFGAQQAANYAWFTKGHGNGPGVTNTINVWQTIGIRHNAMHQDPSQVIRLVYRKAKLLRAGSSTWEDADLYDILSDPKLAPLISHQGTFKTKSIACVAPTPQIITLGHPDIDISLIS